MSKLQIFLTLTLLANLAYADNQYSCSYRVDPKSNETLLSFSLPDEYQFGMLIPVELSASGDKSSKSLMNTVIIKDKPYMVLSDVYRVQSKNSSLVFLMFSPSGKELNVAFVNMGEKPNSIFFNGTCLVK